MYRSIALASLLLLFAGCAQSGPAQAIECGDAMSHPFEARCVADRPAPDNEVCTTWLGEDAELSKSVFCEATTDGHATVHVDFSGSGEVTVFLRNEANDLMVERTFGPGDHALPWDDEAGRWRLVTDFRDTTGPIRVQLWG